MKLSTIKAIKEFCTSEISVDAWREVAEEMSNDQSDFEVGNFRFIDSNEIDEIQQNELRGDKYILGCFNAGFVAGVLDMDSYVIESMQQAEAFEAIGKMIISMGKLEELQEAYQQADGYGHHFNHYDGNEYECNGYLVFQTN